MPGGALLTGRDHDAVSTLALTHVQRAVCQVDQFQPVIGIHRITGDPDGHRELAARLSLSAMEGIVGDFGADLLCSERPGFLVDFGEHDYKFFPTEARDHIRAACVRKQDFGRLPQDLVPEEMPVRIVVVFELVEIQHEDRECAAITTSTLDFRFKVLEEIASVEEPGELVARAQFLGSLVELRIFQRDGHLIRHSLKLLNVRTRESLRLGLVRVQHPDDRSPLDLQWDTEKSPVRGETGALRETCLETDVGHQRGLAALGNQARDPLAEIERESVSALLGKTEGGFDYEATARLVHQEEGIGVNLQRATDKVQGKAEHFLHVQRGGKNPAQCPEGAKLFDLLAEGAVFRLKLPAPIKEALDLFESADFARLALDEELQFLESPLERCVVGLNAFT